MTFYNCYVFQARGTDGVQLFSYISCCLKPEWIRNPLDNNWWMPGDSGAPLLEPGLWYSFPDQIIKVENETEESNAIAGSILLGGDCSSCSSKKCYIFRSTDSGGRQLVLSRCAAYPRWGENPNNPGWYAPFDGDIQLEQFTKWESPIGTITLGSTKEEELTLTNVSEKKCYAWVGVDIFNINKYIYFGCAKRPTWLPARLHPGFFEPGDGDRYIRRDRGWGSTRSSITLADSQATIDGIIAGEAPFGIIGDCKECQLINNNDTRPYIWKGRNTNDGNFYVTVACAISPCFVPHPVLGVGNLVCADGVQGGPINNNVHNTNLEIVPFTQEALNSMLVGSILVYLDINTCTQGNPNKVKCRGCSDCNSTSVYVFSPNSPDNVCLVALCRNPRWGISLVNFAAGLFSPHDGDVDMIPGWGSTTGIISYCTDFKEMFDAMQGRTPTYIGGLGAILRGFRDKDFPKIKPNLIDFELPKYINFNQRFGDTDEILKPAQFIGANGRLIFTFDYKSEIEKVVLEQFYKQNRNRNFVVPNFIFDAPGIIKNEIFDWGTRRWRFADEIIIEPIVLNVKNPRYKIIVKIKSSVS